MHWSINKAGLLYYKWSFRLFRPLLFPATLEVGQVVPEASIFFQLLMLKDVVLSRFLAGVLVDFNIVLLQLCHFPNIDSPGCAV